MIKRKTVETLIGEGKTPEQANEIREQAHGRINKENKVSEMKGLDIQVIRGPNGVAGVDAYMEKFTKGAHAEDYEFVEIDRMEFFEETPNDPLYPSSYSKHHEHMQSSEAWDIHTGTGVVVAICDTGLLTTHPDLKDNMKLPFYNAVDKVSGNDPSLVDPDHPHGTNCAGCAAAKGVSLCILTTNLRILSESNSNENNL